MICFREQAWADYVYWQEHDRKTLKRINALIRDIQRSPFEGIGKPEPLKHHLTGMWSRRIDAEHRLVYAILDGELVVVQCRYHY
jgi:toxin YoeB